MSLTLLATLVGEEAWQPSDDTDGFHADVHDATNGRDAVAWIVKPAVGVVNDAALPVVSDAVAVDEPLQRGAPVYGAFSATTVYLGRNYGFIVRRRDRNHE